MLRDFLKEWDESKKRLAEIVVVIIISVRDPWAMKGPYILCYNQSLKNNEIKIVSVTSHLHRHD